MRCITASLCFVMELLLPLLLLAVPAGLLLPGQPSAVAKVTTK
jgi:hypothetical protein